MLKIWIIGIYNPEELEQYSRLWFHYIEAIESTGIAIPYIIPCNTKYMDYHIANCDGFILPWGQDIDPMMYGEEVAGSIDYSAENDRILLKVIEAVEKTDKLLFGICRGMQLINVYYWGTLIQDIKNTTTHEDIKTENKIAHKIIVQEETILQQAFWKKEIEVNSIHHQAIAKLWKWLEVITLSDDGYIEWIQVVWKNILWVQWHPELLTDHKILFKTIFQKYKDNALKR